MHIDICEVHQSQSREKGHNFTTAHEIEKQESHGTVTYT